MPFPMGLAATLAISQCIPGGARTASFPTVAYVAMVPMELPHDDCTGKCNPWINRISHWLHGFYFFFYSFISSCTIAIHFGRREVLHVHSAVSFTSFRKVPCIVCTVRTGGSPPLCAPLGSHANHYKWNGYSTA